MQIDSGTDIVGINELADWRSQLEKSITSADQLSGFPGADIPALKTVINRYPMRITPYYLSLITETGDPIWRQAIPDPAELEGCRLQEDPLSEEDQSPAPCVIHRYPDRVIFLVSNQCAVYCRFCMRKRKVGQGFCRFNPVWENLEPGIDYIRKTKGVREVILSGGDPLLLSTSSIDTLLSRLRRIEHLEVIRIHSRVVCTLPSRITPSLVTVLKQYHPLYLMTHFNHPAELTSQAENACRLLAEAGIPLGCQSVLLKGINDDPEIMAVLMRKLIKNRVKPYYLHHPDPVQGTAHLRLGLERGLDIMKALRGHVSGLCVPQYMIDLPGGLGKVPVLPDYVRSINNGSATVTNYMGLSCAYQFSTAE